MGRPKINVVSKLHSASDLVGGNEELLSAKMEGESDDELQKKIQARLIREMRVNPVA